MITIPLDNTDLKPFYIQIYEYIRKEILNGSIAAEEKLPSARNLAANLNVSRSTVDTAYDQLVAEGYLDARPRQGYFANHVTHLKQIPTSAPQKENNEKNYVIHSFYGNKHRLLFFFALHLQTRLS